MAQSTPATTISPAETSLFPAFFASIFSAMVFPTSGSPHFAFDKPGFYQHNITQFILRCKNYAILKTHPFCGICKKGRVSAALSHLKNETFFNLF
jgi:hypothetical protein